ncbi:2-oxoacid:ferredoxin oxidoreductase subunit beta [candidate division TA06 bacterium]|uniref:2-oxoacid:ferredoxin oxidoreductase subunit beta n=1 Tax=candidate division TA06 bacterium TaxID=2250710 RepID=A0A660SPE3_UNCT6|nr:MAG: 2-oxoacid:ferredoxin oxidoreductase subunit beta [candidate division TA06 bacterium]
MNTDIKLKYLRTDKLPHIWCPGCGHGIILGAIVKSFDKIGWKKDDIVVVSGIGCSGRTPGYIDTNTLHTTHGRALAFATGIKMAKPNLHIVVIMGDGDASAIGGNHLIHAARRNIDLTAIVFNNKIYGMTGGQYSPTTPQKAKASTAPYGNIEPNFDLVKLVKGAGATYVARATAYHIALLEKCICNGLAHKGFSFIDVLTTCPTQYGRLNKMKSPEGNLLMIKNNTILRSKAEGMTDEEIGNRIIIGEFVNNDSSREYTELYTDEIIKKAMNKE